MKKILLSLVALAGFCSVTYAAGDGSKENPYTVPELIQKGTPAVAEAGVYVQGFIVGSVDGQVYNTGIHFSTEAASTTNIVLAGSSDETDKAFAMPVQLPAGAARNALNLAQNPDNLGHQVLLKCTWEKYFGVNGLKSVTEYEWIGDAPTPGGGSGSDSDGALLVDNMDGFTIDNVVLPDGIEYVWAWDSQYGAKATAYVDNVRYATDAYLISPELAVPAETPYATFSQALNYLSGATRSDFVNVYVREGATGTWTEVEPSAWPAGSDWGFVDECQLDLSAYAGKTIQIGFRYRSTDQVATTWEVKRLKMGAKASSTTPSNPTEVWTVAEALTKLADGYTGAAQVKGYVTQIDELSTQYGNATYFISDDTEGSNSLQVYRGYGLNGAKFTSESELYVGALVVVSGNLSEFNGKYEFETGSKILSIDGNGGGSDTPNPPVSGENGSESKPLSVDQFLAMGTPGSAIANTYVYGYIVGYINGMSLASNAVFGPAVDDQNQTNIMIAASTSVTSTDQVIPVQLPKGAVRDELNLFANPSNLGKEVTLLGSHEKYFGANGLKEVKQYWWGNTQVENVVVDNSEAVYYNLQGVKVNNPEKGIFIKVQGGKSTKVVK